MFIVAPTMERVYELLALVVALFFPVALVTWLVIDKFFSRSVAQTQAIRQPSDGNRQTRAFADHSR